MQKRAIGSQVFSYFLIAVVVIAIGVVGISSVGSVKDKLCKAAIADLQILFEGLPIEMRGGEVRDEIVDIPCNANKIYILDGDSGVRAEWFLEHPLLADSIRSQTDKKIFLLKGDELIAQFAAPNLDLRYPHFLCMVPTNGKVEMRLEGKGNKVAIDAGCTQRLCGQIPEEFDAKKVGRVFRESGKAGCVGCVSDSILLEEAAKARLLYENVDILREYRYCDGKLKMHLLFRPKEGVLARDFRFFEAIPKHCIENLNEVITNLFRPEDGTTFVEPDPLLMWGFNTLSEEKGVYYGLDIILNDQCASAIEGSGVAREVQREEVAISAEPLTSQEVSDIQDERPSIGEQPQQERVDFGFSSRPKTQARVDEPYSYDAQIMGDTDGVTFRLRTAPEGMTIDSATGVVSWIPTIKQNVPVTILANHPSGASKAQDYAIIVENKCESRKEKKCFDGDAYWHDSCGKREDRDQNCPFGCKNGRCCIGGAYNPFCGNENSQGAHNSGERED